MMQKGKSKTEIFLTSQLVFKCYEVQRVVVSATF